MASQTRIPGNEVKVGDVVRFRMSKYEPVKWLKVERTKLHESGKTVWLGLEGGTVTWASIANKSDWVTVRRDHAA